MKYYTGLDVSMKTTSICIINQDKSIFYEETVPTDPVAISNAIKSTGLKVEKIAIESGSISHWLIQELRKRDLPVVCIDSRKMSTVLSIRSTRRIKTTLVSSQKH